MVDTLASSKWQRAGPASIFLVIAITCGYFMDVPTFVTKFPSPSSTGFISHPGGKVKILENFHWIRFLDPIFRDVTPGFAPSTFGYDDVSRWQVFNFFNEIGVWYMIWGMESLRVGVKSGPVYFPAVFATIAQIGGGGVFIPIYYFCNIVYGGPVQRLPPAEKKIDIVGAWGFLVGILIFNTVPLVGALFASTLEQRHWWTWLWQLYAPRITIFWYIAMFLYSAFGLRESAPSPKTRGTVRYQTNVRMIMTPIILVPAAIWIYTLINCPYPIRTVFWPQPLSDPNIFNTATWVERMKRTLIFDQLSIVASTFLWLAWDMKDLKQFVMVCAMGIVIGPGATMGIMWCVRESWIVVDGDKKEKKVKK